MKWVKGFKVKHIKQARDFLKGIPTKKNSFKKVRIDLDSKGIAVAGLGLSGSGLGLDAGVYYRTKKNRRKKRK